MTRPSILLSLSAVLVLTLPFAAVGAHADAQPEPSLAQRAAGLEDLQLRQIGTDLAVEMERSARGLEPLPRWYPVPSRDRLPALATAFVARVRFVAEGYLDYARHQGDAALERDVGALLRTVDTIPPLVVPYAVSVTVGQASDALGGIAGPVGKLMQQLAGVHGCCYQALLRNPSAAPADPFAAPGHDSDGRPRRAGARLRRPSSP